MSFSLYNNINHQLSNQHTITEKNYFEQKYANLNLNLGNKKYLTTQVKDNRTVCVYQIQTSDEILNLIYIQQIEKILKNCSNTT